MARSSHLSYRGFYTRVLRTIDVFNYRRYQPNAPELPNPWDGGNGFDFSGVSFRNYFDENSRGLYIPQGEVVDVAIPEAVSYFGAARCNGAYQDDGFNEIPGYTIAISTAQQINAQYPGADTSENSDFSWADWDQEDVFDYDNDGNFLEPDGYVDHFFLIEPGEHDGGEYGQFLIWPHSADVNPAAHGTGPSGNPLGGYQVALNGSHPLGSIWILNYTVSNETGGLGVLVHEYGHDIGLPDNYGIDGSGANPGFWDLMADGTFGGGVRSMHPTHLTIWDKEFLGWNAPVDIDLTGISASGEANATDFTIGQQSKPPTGTIDGLRINLPDVTTFASVIAFDAHMWWSDKGDDRNESIARNINLQAGETATVTAQMAYFIEEDYDFFYWEISSTMTGGWIPLEVYSGSTLLTTDDNPYGTNLSGNGINGFSTNSDWVQATATITPGAHAGGAIAFRFRYFTDTGFQEEGIYLDNISVSGNMSGLIFTDDAEGGDTWTHLSESSNKNKPWLISDGTRTRKHYYLVEWRNSGEATGANGTSNTAKAFDIAGFDIGLNRAYWISQFDDDFSAVKYDPFFLHTPGMVVWYVNNSYDNNLGSFLFDPPSLGAKGSVLAVDANPYPFIFEDPTLGELVLWERHGSFDAAYTLIDRPAFKLISDIANTGSPLTTLIPGAKGKSVFHDRIGVAPGLFGEPPDNAFFFESDSGVVLPTVNNVPYHPAWDFIGGTGNPGLEAFGINLEVLDQADDGTWGQVRFWLDDDTLFFDKTASNETVIVGQLVTYTLTVKDATGTRYDDNFSYTYSATMTDNLPPFVTYVPGSLSITDGPWTTTPSTATIAGDIITWRGTLGGNPLHVSDAVIQYTVVVSPSATSGALASSAALHIEQILISTDTFNNPLPVPYFWPKQTAYFASSQIKVEGEANGHIYLPSIHE